MVQGELSTCEALGAICVYVHSQHQNNSTNNNNNMWVKCDQSMKVSEQHLEAMKSRNILFWGSDFPEQVMLEPGIKMNTDSILISVFINCHFQNAVLCHSNEKFVFIVSCR